MAIQKRFNGDANGVVNGDISLAGVASAGKVISTGIGKHPTFVKVVAADMTNEFGVGGAVETIIRTICIQATVLAYQVNTTTLSVLLESSGWVDDAALTAAIAAVGNRAADPLVPESAFDFTTVVATTVGGFQLV